MENDLDPDFKEYLNEYRLQSPLGPTSHYDEGELEVQWLNAAGFSALTKPFQQGRELREKDLEAILKDLPKVHADVIRQRVYTLNKTIRGKSKNKKRIKPDIRDVFREFDELSTGTRSGSATPDSLDSLPVENFNSTTTPAYVSTASNYPQKRPHREKLKRTPSVPSRDSAELFRGSHMRCDIPFYTADGIELLGFQKIATVRIHRHRSGSDPSCSVGRHRGSILRSSGSHNNLFIPSSSNELGHQDISYQLESVIKPFCSEEEPISFQGMYNENSKKYEEWISPEEVGIDVNDVNEIELKKLQSLFWLELAALFDKYKITLDKRKPFKKRKKEEGNLFGVSLSTLIRRDQQITTEESILVPLFLQEILNELMKRGGKEEGILRVAGHKQKAETLRNELEINFYQNHDKAVEHLKAGTVHELSALLKNWLRELPQPLLAHDLIQLFYQIHTIPVSSDQNRALSMVCLLLPHEHRNTLRMLLSFLNYIIEKHTWNKMTIQNVATIMAPSFFPPRYIHPPDKNNIQEQVNMAAQCCYMTKILIACGESLFMVPKELFDRSKVFKNSQTKKRN